MKTYFIEATNDVLSGVKKMREGLESDIVKLKQEAGI